MIKAFGKTEFHNVENLRMVLGELQVHDLADKLRRRCENKSPYVKQKALKAIKYLSQKVGREREKKKQSIDIITIGLLDRLEKRRIAC